MCLFVVPITYRHAKQPWNVSQIYILKYYTYILIGIHLSPNLNYFTHACTILLQNIFSFLFVHWNITYYNSTSGVLFISFIIVYTLLLISYKYICIYVLNIECTYFNNSVHINIICTLILILIHCSLCCFVVVVYIT